MKSPHKRFVHFAVDGIRVKYITMKSHPIITLIFLLSSIFSLQANSSWTATAFNITTINEDLFMEVMADLTNNTWQYNEQTFLFSNNGMVSVNNVDADEWKSYTWEMSANGGLVYVNLYDNHCDQIIYRIERDGDMYQWINTTTNLPIKIDSTPIWTTPQMIEAQQSLVGTWNSRFFPAEVVKELKDVEGNPIVTADFRYKLKADGSFQKTIYLNQKQHQVMNGLWQVSSDGKRLVLHFQQKDCDYHTEAASIKLLSMDELVLEQALSSSDLERDLASSKNTFFYSKQ